MRRLSSTRILINGRRPTTPLPPTPATKSSLLWLGVRPWLDPFFPPAADIHMYHTYLQMYHTYINTYMVEVEVETDLTHAGLG
jgi:hypothetical protein